MYALKKRRRRLNTVLILVWEQSGTGN